MNNVNVSKKPGQKNESAIDGKHYERRIVTLIAIKCLLNEKIKDFWFLFNPKEIPIFDDILLLVEDTDGNKRLFMMQLKTRAEDRQLVANQLDSESKDFGLINLQKAYSKIIDDKDFSDKYGIAGKTEKIFVLYTNIIVKQDCKNENIDFQDVSDSEYFEFIDSSSNKANVLKLVKKVDKKDEIERKNKNFKIYNENFLNLFYICASQVNERSVCNTINELLKIGVDKVKALIDFVYDWADPRNKNGKLYKVDIETKLLEIIFGDWQPQPTTVDGSNAPLILNVIEKFNVTVISEEHSLGIIWNESVRKIQNTFGLEIKLSSWNEPISKDIIEILRASSFKNSKEFLQNRQESITMKQLFLFMAVQSLIPFFIKRDNLLFESFKDKLLPVLNIHSVVFNYGKEELQFKDLKNVKIFNSLNDIDISLYHELSEKVLISFQEKPEENIFSLILDDLNVKENISTDNLIKLLHKTYGIGNKSELLGYYVDREISVPVLSKEVLNNKRHLFVVCGVKWGLKGKHVLLLDEYLKEIEKEPNEISRNFEDFNILTTEGEPHEDLLQNIHKMKKSKRVFHILKQVYSNNGFQFLLIYSNKSIAYLKPYCEGVAIKDTELIEIRKGCKVHIICNNAGMGKSTILKFIASKFSPDTWVIHTELRRHITSFKNIKTIEELEKFLCKHEFTKNEPEFYNFLKAMYRNRLKAGKLVWLIDDYELVDDPHLLKLLREANEIGVGFQRNKIEIWIATRPSLKAELENAFNVFSMELTEFNPSNQRSFFEKYFEQKLKSKDNVSSLMEAIENKRHLFEDSFIGICQQTMMFAVLFENGEKQLTKYRIADLYEQFVNLKINEYPEEERAFILRTISKLALTLFFTDEVLKTIFDRQELDEDTRIFKVKYKKDFIITGFADNNLPIFSHQTYAEFLAARWLAYTVIRQKQKKTPFSVGEAVKMLYFNELTTTRSFFDRIITKDYPLHSTVINGEKELHDIFNNSALNDINTTDLLGRSILHIAASYGNRYEVQTDSEIMGLLNNIEQHVQMDRTGEDILFNVPETLTKLRINTFQQVLERFQENIEEEINKRDNFLGLSVLEYALLTGSLEELDIILRNENTFLEDLTDEQRLCLLYHCAKNSFNQILKQLSLDHLGHIKIGSNKMTLLHVAVDSRNVVAVHKFTEQIALTNWAVDDQGNTALHLACEQTNDEMIEILLSSVNIDGHYFNLKNEAGQSHLHCLAYRGHAKWISKIIDYQEIKIDSQCNDGHTPFLASVVMGKTDVAEILRSKGACVNHENKYNQTALHISARKGHYELMNKLIEWGTDVNKPDNYNITPLHYSAMRGHYDCTAKLIECGSDVRKQDGYGMTPLMKASSWGYKDIVELLLKQNTNQIDMFNNLKWTALQFAVRRGQTDIVSVLLDNGANINFPNSRGHTPLITACVYNMPDCVKLLLARGADVDITLKYITRAIDISKTKGHDQCTRLIEEYVDRNGKSKTKKANTRLLNTVIIKN